MTENSERRFGAEMDLLRESYLSFLAGIVVSPAPILTVVILAKNLSTSQLGSYFFILAVAMVVRRPIDGLINTMRKRGVETGAETESYLGFTVLLSIVYLSLIGLLVLFFSGIIVQNTFVSDSEIFAGILLLFSLSITILGTRLQDAIGEPSIGGWMLTFRDYSFISAILLAPSIIGISTSIEFLYVYAIISFFVGLVGILRAGLQPRFPSKSVRSKSINFAIWEIPNVMFAQIIRRAPTIVIGLAVGGVAVGVFESGSQLTLFVPFLAVAIADPLMIKISGKHSEGEPIDTTIISTVNAALFAPILFLSIFLSIGFQGIHLAFDSAELQIWIIGMIVALGRFFESIRMVFSRSLRGADMPEKVSKVIGIGAILSVIILPIFAYFFKETGIAVGFLIIQFLMVLVLGKRTKSSFKLVSFWQPLLGHELLSGVLTAVLLFAYQTYFGITSLIEFIGLSILGVFVFGLILIMINTRALVATRRMIEMTLEIIESQ